MNWNLKKYAADIASVLALAMIGVCVVGAVFGALVWKTNNPDDPQAEDAAIRQNIEAGREAMR